MSIVIVKCFINIADLFQMWVLLLLKQLFVWWDHYGGILQTDSMAKTSLNVCLTINVLITP